MEELEQFNQDNFNQDNSKVEKISLSELQSEKAEIHFEETADKIINDSELGKKCLNYLKEHPEEYKDIFGVDLKIE